MHYVLEILFGCFGFQKVQKFENLNKTEHDYVKFTLYLNVSGEDYDTRHNDLGPQEVALQKKSALQFALSSW